MERIYASSPNISLDYGVLEKSEHVDVLIGDFGWRDIGGWSTLYEMAPKDHAQNVVLETRALMYNCKNNLVSLEIAAESVKVSSVSDFGNVAEVVQATTNGVEMAISMNAKYLLDALHALQEENVVLSFNGAVSPFIVQNAEAKDSLYLILPVRNVA